MEILENWRSLDFQKIIDLYSSVGWSNYTNDPEALKKAFNNSTYIAFSLEESQLTGLIRCISDDISIHYLQDILVHPDFQRGGVGRALFNNALNRFEHVRTHMLLTDDEPKQREFYESLGYKNIKDLRTIKLNSFVMMKGAELS